MEGLIDRCSKENQRVPLEKKTSERGYTQRCSRPRSSRRSAEVLPRRFSTFLPARPSWPRNSTGFPSLSSSRWPASREPCHSQLSLIRARVLPVPHSLESSAKQLSGRQHGVKAPRSTPPTVGLLSCNFLRLSPSTSSPSQVVVVIRARALRKNLFSLERSCHERAFLLANRVFPPPFASFAIRYRLLVSLIFPFPPPSPSLVPFSIFSSSFCQLSFLFSFLLSPRSRLSRAINVPAREITRWTTPPGKDLRESRETAGATGVLWME